MFLCVQNAAVKWCELILTITRQINQNRRITKLNKYENRYNNIIKTDRPAPWLIDNNREINKITNENAYKRKYAYKRK